MQLRRLLVWFGGVWAILPLVMGQPNTPHDHEWASWFDALPKRHSNIEVINGHISAGFCCFVKPQWPQAGRTLVPQRAWRIVMRMQVLLVTLGCSQLPGFCSSCCASCCDSCSALVQPFLRFRSVCRMTDSLCSAGVIWQQGPSRNSVTTSALLISLSWIILWGDWESFI